MSHIFSHALGLTFIVALLTATGYLVERSIPPLREVGRSIRLTRLIVGIGTWMVLTFILAATRQLRWGVVTVIAAAIIGVTAVAALMQRRHQPPRTAPQPSGPSPSVRDVLLWAAALVVPASVVAALFVLQLRPWVAFDDQAYHLTLPKLYLAAEGFRHVAFNIYSHWPHGVELLYAVAMLWQDFVLAKLVAWLFLILLLIAVIRFCTALGSRVAAAVSASLILANVSLLFEATTAYVDIAFGFWFFASFVFMLEYLDRRSRAALAMSALASGIAACTKLSGLFVPVCLTVLVWTDPAAWRLGLRARLHATIALWGVTILLASPWYVKSFLQTGSPAFPFLYKWLPDRLGGMEWSPLLAEQFTAWLRGIGMGRGWRDYVLLPLRVSVYGQTGPFRTFDGRLNPLWAALWPLSIVVSFLDARVRRCTVVGAAYFVLWALSSQQIRFLIPMLPFAACATGFAAARGLDALDVWRAAGLRQPSNLPRTAAVAAVGIVAAAQVTLAWVARYHVQDAFRFGVKLVRQGPPAVAAAQHDIFDYIDRHLPFDSRLMLLNTNQGFFLNREFIADSAPQVSQMNDLLWRDPEVAGIDRLLGRLQITHLLVNSRNWGIRYPDALWDLLADPARARQVYAAADGKYLLYELVTHGR